MSTLIQRKTGSKSETSNAAPTPSSTTSTATAATTEEPQASSSSRSSKFKDKPPQLRNHKVFVRVVLATSIFVIVYFTSNKEKTSTLAGYRELVPLREHKLTCTADSFTQFEIENYPKCISYCKRLVTDNLFNENEIAQLKELTDKIFTNEDDASRIYDLKSTVAEGTVHDTIKSIQPKIIENIAQRFEISHKSLYLASPTYFSKITNVTNEYSEPLHRHRFDKEENKHVHYTVIVFLSTYKRDHNSGRFIFVDIENKRKKNSIVDPKIGRTVMYSTGEENIHVFENVLNGHLSFMTLSFTCDKDSVLLLK